MDTEIVGDGQKARRRSWAEGLEEELRGEFFMWWKRNVQLFDEQEQDERVK